MTNRSRNTGSLVWVLLVLVAALLAATATVASAAPQEPYLTTDELNSALGEAPDGVLHGYLKTVLKGSTIETVPVDVLAVTAGFADGPGTMSSLILFQAYGPKIDKIGGIAAGMSGSPIYVTDDEGENPELVGALSYGDTFTLDGMGLATPIEAMAGVESLSSPMIPLATRTQTLAEPVRINGETKDRVIVTEDPNAYKGEAEDGAIVAKPLAGVFIGGLRPGTRMYKDFVESLERRGLSVTKIATGLSSNVSTYSAPFEAGSSLAVLASRGDLWVGGVGTATYVNDSKVLGFGHPAFWTGDSGAYMCNAWVDGIWPSTLTAYKLARPAAVRGTMTQDRLPAVMGVEGEMPTEVPVTARTLNLDTGQIGTATSYLPSAVINSPKMDFEGLAPIATYLSTTRVFDVWAAAGSAMTTTTVTVEDGTDVYEITRANVFDSDYDIAYDTITDVADIVYALQQLGANGIAHPEITSVDLDCQVTNARNLAEIVDFDVPGGLKRGDNTVEISLLRHGSAATETIETTLTVPNNVPLSGVIDVSASEGGFGGSMYFDLFEEYDSEFSMIDRRTTAEAVDDLRSQLPNSAFTVTFDPMRFMSMGPGNASYDSVEATSVTPWYMTGSVEKIAPQIALERYSSSTISYNGSAYFLAEVFDLDEETEYSVYRRYAGEASPTLVSTGSIDPEMGEAEFRVRNLRKKAEITFVVDKTDSTLAASASTTINVRPVIALRSSATSVARGRTITLSTNVLPTNAVGKIVFERWDARSFRWISIASKTIVSGKASTQFRMNSTKKFRARYTGSSNAPATSSSVTVRVR